MWLTSEGKRIGRKVTMSRSRTVKAEPSGTEHQAPKARDPGARPRYCNVHAIGGERDPNSSAYVTREGPSQVPVKILDDADRAGWQHLLQKLLEVSDD